jgi:transposase
MGAVPDDTSWQMRHQGYDSRHEARQRQQTMDFKRACQLCAGVEGTVSQVAYTLGARQLRYQGVAKTHLSNLATVAAGDLLRIIAWLNDVPRAATPKSHLLY